MNQEKDMDTDRKLPCGPEKDIGYYIKRINDKLKAGFDAYLCDVDLTSSQARVLEYVYWNGSQISENVLFQAEFLQGSGVWKQIDNQYFCYE